MTAISAVASPRSGQIGQQLRSAGSRPSTRGPRYVNTVFSIRFERERAAVDSLHQDLEGSQRMRLWAAAELIAALRWQLDHLAGACHHAAEFATVTLKLEGAIEYWCREVEAALGQLTWGQVPEKSRQLLVCIDDQEDPYGT